MIVNWLTMAEGIDEDGEMALFWRGSSDLSAAEAIRMLEFVKLSIWDQAKGGD